MYGAAWSLTYLCTAESAPAAALKLELVPSPHVTVTVYGPVPPANEPRLKVTLAPSFALWLGPGVSVSVAGATSLTATLALGCAGVVGDLERNRADRTV